MIFSIIIIALRCWRSIFMNLRRCTKLIPPVDWVDTTISFKGINQDTDLFVAKLNPVTQEMVFMSPELGVSWFSGWYGSTATAQSGGWTSQLSQLLILLIFSDLHFFGYEGFGPRELGMRWEPGPNGRVPRIFIAIELALLKATLGMLENLLLLYF